MHRMTQLLRSASRTEAAIALLLALMTAFSLWWLLAPATIGGPAHYTVVEGQSMLPRFHGGDLVVLRSQSEYKVGDVAAYRSPTLHIVVMHRVISEQGGRYTFRGDNNNFTDPSVIGAADIIGSPWVHLPKGGKVLLILRQPLVAAWFFGLLTWWAMQEPTQRTAERTRLRRLPHSSRTRVANGEPG